MSERREQMVRFGAAIWGLAMAIALRPWWSRPAPAGQLPGLMTSLGLDASAAPRFVVGLMLLPILSAWMSRPLSRRLAEPDARAWPWIAVLTSMAASLWFVMIEPSVLWVVTIPLATLVLAIPLRRFDARFDRHDWILLPVAAAVELALLDLSDQPLHHAVVVAVAIVFALRLAVAALQRTAISPGLCFAFAPLALLSQTHVNGYHHRHAPWPPMLIATIAPILVACIRWDAVRLRKGLVMLTGWFVYPLAIVAYLSATSALAAEGMPRADLFEDAHHLVPASEMLRGETLYRDILPAHGLIQDALLDFVAFSTGSPSIGRALKVRSWAGPFCIVAQYAVTAAATGCAEAGLGAAMLVVLLGTSAGSVRALPALFALAIVAVAVRRRQPRLFLGAGIVTVLSVLTSLDFGAYASMTLLLSLLRTRSDDEVPRLRARAWQNAAAGVGGASLVALAAMAIRGFAGSFLRVTLFEIPSLSSVYALAPFDAPAALQSVHNIPEVLAMLFDKSAYLYLAWVGALLFVALMMTASRQLSVVTASEVIVTSEANTSIESVEGLPHAASRQRPIGVLLRASGVAEASLMVAFFTVVSAFSYAERHHTYWQFGVPALLAIALFVMIVKRSPLSAAGAATLIVILLVTAQPTTHLAIAASLRRIRGPLDAGWRTIDLPRARGALFSDRDARVVDVVQRYAATHLQPGETFFDFTNRGGLYFFLDRDCPIRQIEVAFYEPAGRQQDVIARIEGNPRIRFAIVPAAHDDTAVDGVPNATRAPLVWQYLQQHFTPDYEEDGVVFWRRNLR